MSQVAWGHWPFFCHLLLKTRIWFHHIYNFSSSSRLLLELFLSSSSLDQTSPVFFTFSHRSFTCKFLGILRPAFGPLQILALLFEITDDGTTNLDKALQWWYQQQAVGWTNNFLGPVNCACCTVCIDCIVCPGHYFQWWHIVKVSLIELPELWDFVKQVCCSAGYFSVCTDMWGNTVSGIQLCSTCQSWWDFSWSNPQASHDPSGMACYHSVCQSWSV